MVDLSSEKKEVLLLDRVVEPVILVIFVALLVIGRFLSLSSVGELIYFSLIILGFFYTIYWYHLYPIEKYGLKRVTISIPIYSLLIAFIAHFSGGIDSPIFPAFFMPIIIVAYGLPPAFVTIATVIPSLFIAFELVYVSLYLDTSDSDIYAFGVIKSLLIILIATFAYFLSVQKQKNKQLLSNIVDDLENKDQRQKEAITELIDTERELRLQRQQLENRNEELIKMRKSVLNILDDLEKERSKIEIERNRFESVLESTSEGIMMIDQNYRPVLINKRFEELFGLKKKSLLGKDSFNYIKLAKEYFKDKKEFDLWEEEVESSDLTRELDWEMNSDPIRYVKRFTTPVLGVNNERLGRIWTFRDVTRDREIDQMRSEFVSLASHQLRTPLSAIKWFLEMVINEEVGKLKPKQKELLQKTYDSSERMTELVNSLLNISRIESGRISVNPKPTDIVVLTQDIVEQLKPLYEKKSQTVDFKIEKEFPIINIDKRLVGESISNFISNAVKYTPEKGKIFVRLDKDSENVILSVKDNGFGIPSREHHRVFEKFYRSDKAIASETEGTGLGLFIVKSVIESSGGKVWFESEEGKGSTFYLSLPLKGSEEIKGEKSLA